MMRTNILAIFLMTWFLSGTLFPKSSEAQVRDYSPPFSFTSDFPPSALATVVPKVIAPLQDNDQLLLSRNQSKGVRELPYNATKVPLNLDFKAMAVMNMTPEGHKVWRLEIVSTGAYGISLFYEDFFLTEDAEVHVYSPVNGQSLGAFTKSKNGRTSGLFRTSYIKGERIVIELFEPSYGLGTSNFIVNGLAHQFVNVWSSTSGGGSNLGESSGCSPNVKCKPIFVPNGGYPENTNGVAKLEIDCRTCTGAMINTYEQSGRLYLLTAYHCIDLDKDCQLSSSELSALETMTVTFNYQSDNCNDLTSDPANLDEVVGARFVVGDYETDYALLELLEKPPDAYNIYLCGFNADATDNGLKRPLMTYTIHHPAGDIKKVAADDDSPSIGDWLDPSDPDAACDASYNSHWIVRYNDDPYSLTNGLNSNGLTEPGSSGAPLFDENGRIIGQLTGGTFADRDNIDCEEDWNSEHYFGWFRASWHHGLKNYLAKQPGTTSEIVDGTYLSYILDQQASGNSIFNYECDYDADPKIINDRQYNGVTKLKYSFNEMKILGNTNVKNGSNVAFYSNDFIEMRGGFDVDASSTFIASNARGCLPNVPGSTRQYVDDGSSWPSTLNEMDVASEIRNPAVGYVYENNLRIQFDHRAYTHPEAVEIKLISMSGTVLLQSRPNQTERLTDTQAQVMVDLPALARGVYIFEITDGTRTEFGKVVI